MVRNSESRNTAIVFLVELCQGVYLFVIENVFIRWITIEFASNLLKILKKNRFDMIYIGKKVILKC